MAQKATAYDVITDRIISALEDGVVPWHRPWRATDVPRSMSSGKPYRGINVLMLTLTAQAKGYDSPFWLTYKQAQARGGCVRKGEKSTPVVLWKRTQREDKTTGDKRPSVFLRYYSVFNLEQCDDVEAPEQPEVEPFDPCIAAEDIAGHYLHQLDGPSLAWGGDRAYYAPYADHVQMPHAEGFTAPHRYYSTLFHELVHSTGSEKRLKRASLIKDGREPYSREELVAEIGACFLTSTADLEVEFEQSAAYIKSWLRALQDDPKMVVQAAAAAQKAVDHILGTTFDTPATPEPALATA